MMGPPPDFASDGCRREEEDDDDEGEEGRIVFVLIGMKILRPPRSDWIAVSKPNNNCCGYGSCNDMWGEIPSSIPPYAPICSIPYPIAQ